MRFLFLVSSNDLQRIKKTIDNIYVEKQKMEKEKSKKGAGGKGKGKAKLRMEGDNVRYTIYLALLKLIVFIYVIHFRQAYRNTVMETHMNMKTLCKNY